MKLKLYQSFHTDDAPLDAGAIAMDNRGVNVHPLYENVHIRKIYPTLEGAEYYGLTSWRMHEKTGYTKDKLEEFIKDHPGYDAYLYGEQGSKEALVQNMKGNTPIGLAWKRLGELSLFKNRNIPSNLWINCFCNFWAADKKTWDRYMVYLEKAIALFDSDPVLSWIMQNTCYYHRDNAPYPIHPFVLEYLFGLFLEDNPDIKWISVPNLLLKKNSGERMFRPNSLSESLKTIYQSYKTNEFGRGDKGTLHGYIDNYDKLLAPYRFTSGIVLEIGVAEGFSLKMWREYFAIARIVGIDIEKPRLELPGCEFYFCDQSNKSSLMELLPQREFDVIIDDGSHKLEHQITSFNALFPRLNKGGIYIIEDIQDLENELPIFTEKCGKPTEIYDTRKQTGRYDDVLLVWRK